MGAIGLLQYVLWCWLLGNIRRKRVRSLGSSGQPRVKHVQQTGRITSRYTFQHQTKFCCLVNMQIKSASSAKNNACCFLERVANMRCLTKSCLSCQFPPGSSTLCIIFPTRHLRHPVARWEIFIYIPIYIYKYTCIYIYLFIYL